MKRLTEAERARIREANDQRALEIRKGPMTPEERRAHGLACNEEMHRARIARGEDLPGLFDHQGGQA